MDDSLIFNPALSLAYTTLSISSCNSAYDSMASLGREADRTG